MAVEFKDYSFEVKAELNDITKAWLYEAGNEIASHAKDNCTMTDDNGQLRGSYRADVNAGAGSAKIGTGLESGYWEEYGTGAYAANGDGRQGWWVYIEGGSGYEGATNHYDTQEKAQAAAAFIQRKYKKPAVATNGRKPAYTLEKAFIAKKPKVIAELEKRLRGL